jgi:hypothetical protein
MGLWNRSSQLDVGWQRVDGENGEFLDVLNPATGATLGRVLVDYL